MYIASDAQNGMLTKYCPLSVLGTITVYHACMCVCVCVSFDTSSPLYDSPRNVLATLAATGQESVNVSVRRTGAISVIIFILFIYLYFFCFVSLSNKLSVNTKLNVCRVKLIICLLDLTRDHTTRLMFVFKFLPVKMYFIRLNHEFFFFNHKR